MLSLLFPAALTCKSAITVSPAFKQSLFESQLEDYFSDMQRVCFTNEYIKNLFNFPLS